MKKPEQSKTTVALKENILEYNMWIKLSKSCSRKKNLVYRLLEFFILLLELDIECEFWEKGQQM